MAKLLIQTNEYVVYEYRDRGRKIYQYLMEDYFIEPLKILLDDDTLSEMPHHIIPKILKRVILRTILFPKEDVSYHQYPSELGLRFEKKVFL